MIRFEFLLRPVDEIPPWGGDHPTLHWFPLTSGWYWIRAGDHELLRYSDRTLRGWRVDTDGVQADPHVDHYVVRLWEDLLEVLPEAMEPVPADLVDFVSGAVPQWASWEDISPAAETAGLWHASHSMYTGPLRNPPHLRWWRTITDGEDVVTLSWEQRPDPEIEFAGPAKGRCTVPASAFVAAVEELDRALLTAMGRRVTALETAGGPPGVELDLTRLRREQEERTSWLRRALRREVITDWAAVREGAGILLDT